MSYTLNITIEGYEGNDPAVLGAITLKRLLPTEEEWTPVPSMTGNVITCTVEIPNTGTYQWNLGGTPFAYQEALNGQGLSSSYSPKFFSVYFKNGSETYATEYVSKTNFINFPNKVTAPPAPTREGYTFAGWVTQEGGSDAFDFDSAITDVTTVYASWTKNVEPPVITQQPSKNLSCPTHTYTRLTIAASGDDLTYQWQVNKNDGAGFEDIAGEKSALMTIAYPKESQDGYLYRCVVTNAGGSVTSEETELAVSDVRAGKAEPVVREALDGMTVTNDTDEESILNIANAALSNASITKVDVIVYRFSKTEATEDAPGNIRVEIGIECGVSREYMEIDRVIAQLTHTCSLSPMSKAEPDCTTAGREAYYHCVGCGKNYEDAEGTTLIADLDSWGNIAALGHDYETAWKSDEESHWHSCSRCNAKTEVSAHTEDGGTVTKEPTETETGIRTYCCPVCSRELRTETIPATGGKEEPGGDAGTVDTEVERDEKAPVTQLLTPVNQLKDMLLTEEEKQQVQDGANIKIVLDVQDAENTVSASDKEKTEQALNGFTVGQYLNIELYSLTSGAGEGTRREIKTTDEAIRIVIDVPEAIKNRDDSRTRTFAVIRVHDGNAVQLPDLDNSEDTITIETDRFSSYAVAYQDTPKGSGDDNNQGGGGNDQGGDNSQGSDQGSDDNGQGSSGDDNNQGSGDNDQGGDNSQGDSSGDNDQGSGGDNSQGGSSSGDNSGGGSGVESNGNSASDSSSSAPNKKDSEPKTGDAAPVELYATLAMIAGFAYLLLYFTDRRGSMTEEAKKELVSRLVRWAKQGGRLRKCLALAAIFVLLVYYHGTRKWYRSTDRKTCIDA